MSQRSRDSMQTSLLYLRDAPRMRPMIRLLLSFLLILYLGPSTYPIQLGIHGRIVISKDSSTTVNADQHHTTSESSCNVSPPSQVVNRIPKPYEFSIDFDLPSVSYLALRREMLSDQSDFWINTVMSKALQNTLYVCFYSSIIFHTSMILYMSKSYCVCI